ncbi:general substrate transporter [Cadophora sp. DSE1049]|nr:general substrate transporter [Cadophora sp. DSE1049]
MSAAAQGASTQEHDMTIKQAIRIYRPAIWWCYLWAASVIMQSFAIALIPSFFAQDQFSRKYGTLSSEEKYEIPAGWRAGLTVGALVGEMFGLVISGTASEKYGYKKTMIVALILTTGLIFIPFFAGNIQVLLVGQILGGVPWGMFQSMPSSFASDIMPQVLRPYLTTYINLCWVFGQLIATVAVRAVLSLDNEWAYRIPFALQWIWPLLIIGGIIWSPESPAWLVRKNRMDEATRSLLRLTTRGHSNFNVDDAILLIAETNEKEMRMSSGTSYRDCFRGVDFRRTRIACLAWLVQCLCGSVLMGYSPVVYKACGLDGVWAFNMTMIQYAINIVGTFLAWWFMHLSGRRSLYLYGCMALFVLLISIGSTAFTSSTNKPAQWGMAIQYLLYTFVYGCTIGPVCFSLVTEMSSMRLKTKTIVLARISYNIGSIIVNNLANYQLTPSPSGWGWCAKSALFWAGSTLACIIWIYFELPEPKGRTYCDMDVMFDHGISARKFSKTNVPELASRPRENGNARSTANRQNAAAENNGTELANMSERTNA